LKKNKSIFLLLLLLPFLFFEFIPQSKADISIPLIRLPYPDLTLYYLIEGEGILQTASPILTYSSGRSLNLPIDILQVQFPKYLNGSDNAIEYNLRYFGSSRTTSTSINILSRMSNNSDFCPFYIKYSGLPNILGIDFDWVYEYGGVKYIKWHDSWIKTILYYYNYQDGSISYSYRFYYDYHSLILIQMEEETVSNLIQTQYLKYSLIIGNILLLPENTFTGEWSQLVNLVIGVIITCIFTITVGFLLLKKKQNL